MLASMQQDARDANAGREKDGFASVDFLGWAAQPHYDKETRKLYWAKRLQFGDSESETLNYNIRVLGRKGVLELNFIAKMDQLAEIEKIVPQVLQMVNFTQGNRYADFIPGTDTIAAVGIGGLIAGKLAAKAGLLVLALAFLKKGIVLIFLPALWVWRKIKSAIFGRNTTADADVSGAENAPTDIGPPIDPEPDSKDGRDS